MKTKRKMLSLIRLMLLAAIAFFGSSAAKAQDSRLVVLYEGENNDGAYQEFTVGTKDLKNNYIDNRASSISVPDGFEVLACHEKPINKLGELNLCTKYPEGKYSFKKNDKKISYLEVRSLKESFLLSGKSNVCLYTDADGAGYTACLEEFGRFPLTKTVFPKSLLTTTADRVNADWGHTISSIRVFPKTLVTLFIETGKSAGGGSVKNITKIYKPGFYNLDEEFNNNVASIKIESAKPKSSPIQTQKVIKSKP